MRIIDFYRDKDREYWLGKLHECTWSGGGFLCELITKEQFYETLGNEARLFLLTEGDDLISFCTYAPRDDISDTDLEPWIGFVFTFPAHRGKRRMGKLFEYIYSIARREGKEHIYLSTNEDGLYEKYRFRYLTNLKDYRGYDSRIYVIDIKAENYSGIIGSEVAGIIDRPKGSHHPEYPEMIYMVDYGFIPETDGGDGEPQDAYVFGLPPGESEFRGEVIAVYHRINDDEDKWIVSCGGSKPDARTILKSIEFQEQYFMGELYM